MKKIKKITPYMIILIMSAIVSVPLLSPNINIYQDDGVQHICRLIGTWQTIKSGEFMPMIMSNFLNNFGYSWNLFYSPLTAFAPLILKIFNLSFIEILKIFLFVITFLSGLMMYKCTLRIIGKGEEKNKIIALISSMLYIYAPYRLTDMYIRMAVAELASFIFIPLIFEGIWIAVHENKKSYLLAIGTAGIVLTHTVITMYTAILCFIYLIIELIIKAKNKENIKSIIIEIFKNIFFAIIITSIYWVPLLEHYFATSYEVFVPGRMQRIEVLKSLKLKVYELFFTTSQQIRIYDIGFVNIIGLLLTPIAFKKIEKNLKPLYVFCGISGVILCIMTLAIFPFEKLPSILTMIQFTFRLLEFTSFFFAIISAINLGMVIKDIRYRDFCAILVILILITSTYIGKLNFDSKYTENDLIEPVKFSENTGRVHCGMASMEYMPSKMFNNKEYVINRKDEPLILNSSKTLIKYYEKNSDKMVLRLENAEAGTTIELPYTYYLGYRIYENGNEIEYTESDNGFIQITLEKQGNVEIKIRYLGTNGMVIASVISILGTIYIIAIKLTRICKKETV